MKKIYFENFKILNVNEIYKLRGYRNFYLIEVSVPEQENSYYYNSHYTTYLNNSIVKIQYFSNERITTKEFFTDEKILFTGCDLLSLADYHMTNDSIASFIMNTE